MITVEHLTKRYGDITAVDDLSFEIKGGSCMVFRPHPCGENHHAEHHDRLSFGYGGRVRSAAMIF